jgi:heptosyltransferase I
MAKIQVIDSNRKIILKIINAIVFFITPIFFVIKMKSPFGRKKRFSQNKDKASSIILNLNSRIGDTIFTLPLLETLKNEYNEAKIYVVANQINSQLLKNNPHIYKIIIFNSDWIFESAVNLRKILKSFKVMDYIRFLRELRKIKADVIIEIDGTMTNILMIDIFSRAKFIVGNSICGLSYFFDRTANYKIHNAHEIDNRLKIADCFDIEKKIRKIDYYFSDDDTDFAAGFFKKYNIKEKDFSVIFHLGAGWEKRQWPLMNFLSLAKELVKLFKAKIILVGSIGDKKLIAEFIEEMPDTLKADGLKLNKVAAIMKKAQLFVGNDSGPLHIARSVGTRVVALLGPDLPSRVGPEGDGIYICKNFSCQPCGQMKCTQNPNCIEAITVDEVVRAIQNDFKDCLPK